VSGTSPEQKTTFAVAFDRQTLELVALERYATTDAALAALDRHEDDGKLAVVIDSENEATLRTTHDLEEIARELRQEEEWAEADDKLTASIIAASPTWSGESSSCAGA
jgi:hypothetical protein